MKRTVVIFLWLLSAIGLNAATNVSGNISTDTTWDLAGSPYILTGDVTVGGSGGPTLTIDAGVIVKGNANSQLLVNFYNKGALVANGTASDPILFTSNGTATASYWYGLRFGSVAGAPASSLTYVTVEYGGSDYHQLGGITVLQYSPAFDHVTSRVHQYAGIKIENGSPTITSSSIRENAGHGIYTTNGNVTLTDVELIDNTNYAISAAAITELLGMTGITVTSNGTNAIEYRAGDITANRTWRTAPVPYIVNGSVMVQHSSAPILTIQAGNTIRFQSNSQIAVNHTNKGGLVVNGTSSDPVLFTSNAGSPTAGSWWGLYFGQTSGPPASSVSYATIEYGGYSAANRGGVTIYTGSPAFDHVTIRNSSYAGVAVHGGSPSIATGTIEANGGPGIYAINAANFTLSDIAFTNNSGYAVTAPATSTFANMSGLSASGNGTGRDGVEVRAGTMQASTTWPTSAIPYIISGTLDVMASGAPVLTIAPGNTIKFNANSQLSCNHAAKGAIHAVGTAGSPILFTSNTTATQGAWWGLWFGPAAAPPQSTIAYATIEYGGFAGVSRGGITVNANSPIFDHVTVRNNQFAGIVLAGGSATVTDSTITANGGAGINATGGTGLTLTGTAITNNNGMAVTVPVSVAISSATGLSASGNGTGKDAIEVRGGTITANTTWPASPIAYVVNGTIDVNAASAPVLTIAAGNTIKFNSNSQISVNHFSKGALQAVGTSGSPILFTTNGTATPGAWLGLWFGPTANPPQSNVSYATIEYGGSNGNSRGGVTIHAGSPLFDHVTFRNNQFAGVAFTGGAPVVRNSTITANSGPGINGTGGTGITISDTAFTNNSGYAVTLPVTAPLSDATGLTASGNGTGRDGIEYRGGTIVANTTWPLSSIPYIVSYTIDVNGSAAPVLTIAAGNTIRFNGGAQLSCNHYDRGALQAVGTPAAPILFTSNGTTAAGYWQGLWFGPAANPPQSNIAYATIEYAGNDSASRGGITVNGTASPIFEHLILRNHLQSGITANSNSSPRITNSVFMNSPSGVKTTSNATVIAPLNYWNHADGPCAPGSCATGQQSVSAAVMFEPWLLSSPSEPQFLATASQKNRAFSPAIGAQTTVDYTTSLTGNVAVTIRDASSATVRTFNTSGTSGSFVWDGKDGSGVVQPDGTYSYELAATATSQPPASIARGHAVIDSTRTLTLSNPAASQAFFSPNADSVKDTTTVTATTNYDDAAWTVTVLDASSATVRTQNGTGTAVSFVWNGRDGSAVLQPDGVYTLRVDATVGTASQQKSTTTTLDNTAPVATILTPAASQVLSNVYTNGVTIVTPTGNATDLNLLDWTMQFGSGASPSSWTTIGNGTSAVSSSNLGNWQTATHTNGTYALKLMVNDKAGNPASTTTSPITLGNFKASQNAYQLNPSTGGTITYTSTVPFPLTETIFVKNEAGATVRTVVNAAARAAGTHNDVFDGRNDATAILPDGPYFYFATVTDGTHTFTWDQSNEFRNDYGGWNDGLNIQAFDPFNNKPMKFNYTWAQPGRVTIATTAFTGSVIGDCAQPPTPTFYCPVIDQWQESGTHSFVWSGIDHTGQYRTVRSVAMVTTTANFPKNAAVVFGTKPKVENVEVTPPIYGPAVGTQTIEFDLTTYQSQAANVTISFVNLSTLSTLRTVTLSNQSPGPVSTTWDGRADNGMLVAPGDYDVIVTVTDSLGNVVKSDILTHIQY